MPKKRDETNWFCNKNPAINNRKGIRISLDPWDVSSHQEKLTDLFGWLSGGMDKIGVFCCFVALASMNHPLESNRTAWHEEMFSTFEAGYTNDDLAKDHVWGASFYPMEKQRRLHSRKLTEKLPWKIVAKGRLLPFPFWGVLAHSQRLLLLVF